MAHFCEPFLFVKKFFCHVLVVQITGKLERTNSHAVFESFNTTCPQTSALLSLVTAVADNWQIEKATKLFPI